MRVLVTRPAPDGDALSLRLRTAGHQVIAAPLLTIQFEDVGAPDLAAFQAILLTSANGARALARLTDDRALPVLTVGDATARAAREAGFGDVRVADGDVETLAALAQSELDPMAKPLLHVAGSVVAGDLKGALDSAGFTVTRLVAYRAEAATGLTDEALDAFREGAIDLALFYSPRTARIFSDLAQSADIESALQTVTAGCLSGAVRDALQSLPWKRIVVAGEPMEAALLAAAGLNTKPN